MHLFSRPILPPRDFFPVLEQEGGQERKKSVVHRFTTRLRQEWHQPCTCLVMRGRASLNLYSRHLFCLPQSHLGIIDRQSLAFLGALSLLRSSTLLVPTFQLYLLIGWSLIWSRANLSNPDSCLLLHPFGCGALGTTGFSYVLTKGYRTKIKQGLALLFNKPPKTQFLYHLLMWSP